MTEKLDTKFITPPIVCSYPYLAEKGTDLSGREAYSLSIPLPKDDKKATAKLKEVMSNAAVNEWGAKFKDVDKAGVSHHVVPGDDEDPVYENTLRFSAKSQKRQPVCGYFNADKVFVQVPQDELDDYFYPGAIIRASVSAYATDAGGRKTIAFALNNVLFVKHGERIGGGTNPNDDFGAFADEAAQTEQEVEEDAIF